MSILYMIDEDHEALIEEFLERFEMTSLYEDREYGALCYLLGAVDKTELLKLCSTEGVMVNKMLNDCGPYSTTQHNFIRLGLHLFNERNCSDLSIMDLFAGLDQEHRKVVYTALEIRYGLMGMTIIN